MAKTGLTPSQLVQHLFDQVGPHYYHRRDVHFNPDDRDRIEKLLRSPQFTELAGIPVRGTDDIDGRRFVFDEGWLICRFSGTEPLLRIYAEAGQPQMVDALLNAAAGYLGV
jgi:phosphomannomutase